MKVSRPLRRERLVPAGGRQAPPHTHSHVPDHATPSHAANPTSHRGQAGAKQRSGLRCSSDATEELLEPETICSADVK